MKKVAVIKILEKYDIDEYHYKLEIAAEIIALEQQSKFKGRPNPKDINPYKARKRTKQ